MARARTVGSGGAVAGLVVGLGGHALDELRADVPVLVLPVDGLRHRHTVLGDLGRTERLLNDHITPLGTERDGHSIRQTLYTNQHLRAGLGAEADVLAVLTHAGRAEVERARLARPRRVSRRRWAGTSRTTYAAGANRRMAPGTNRKHGCWSCAEMSAAGGAGASGRWRAGHRRTWGTVAGQSSRRRTGTLLKGSSHVLSQNDPLVFPEQISGQFSVRSVLTCAARSCSHARAPHDGPVLPGPRPPLPSRSGATLLARTPPPHAAPCATSTARSTRPRSCLRARRCGAAGGPPDLLLSSSGGAHWRAGRLHSGLQLQTRTPPAADFPPERAIPARRQVPAYVSSLPNLKDLGVDAVVCVCASPLPPPPPPLR